MKSKTFTEEELNSVSKEMVIKMYLQLAESFEKMTIQLENLTEQVAILTQQRFGRKTEKASLVTSDQITMADILPDDMKDILNEAEATADDSAKEPEMETIVHCCRCNRGQVCEPYSVKSTFRGFPTERLRDIQTGTRRLDDSAGRKISACGLRAYEESAFDEQTDSL